MKSAYFLLLLLLFPCFSFASGHFHERYHMAIEECNHAYQLIDQANTLGLNQSDTTLNLLDRAIAHFNQAIAHCNALLEKIHEKEKSEKKKWHRSFHDNHPVWREQLKEAGKNLKSECHERIAQLRATQNQIVKIVQDTDKSIDLYKESLKNSQLAMEKYQACFQENTPIEAIFLSLSDAAQLFEKAALLAYEASECSPYSQDKTSLQEIAASCEEAATKCKEEILNLETTWMSRESA